MNYSFICLLLSVILIFHTATGQTTRILRKNIELKMPDEEGSNGASVVWHPVQKKYYAAMAGKTTCPMAVFEITGKRISPDGVITQADVRGLWYNNETKLICGNAFKNVGWFSYTLDPKGLPQGLSVFLPGANQPGPQSVGAYNSKNNLVYFLNKTRIVAYSQEGKLEEDSVISLELNIPEEFEDKVEKYMEDNYNNTSIVFTGINKSEFGLLNYAKSRIELYDKSTGELSQLLRLPDDAITYDWLNFSLANGIYWLFDKDNRKWVGYK